MSSWAPRLGSGYSRWMFHEARGLPHLQSCLKTCPGREALEHGTWNWRNHPGFQHKISAQNGPGNGNSLCSMLDGKRWKKGQIGQYIQHPFSFVGSHLVSTSDIGRSWRWGTDADVVLQNRKAVHLQRQAEMLMRHVCNIWEISEISWCPEKLHKSTNWFMSVHGSTSSGIESGKNDQQNWKSLRMALSCWSAASMLR